MHRKGQRDGCCHVRKEGGPGFIYTHLKCLWMLRDDMQPTQVTTEQMTKQRYRKVLPSHTGEADISPPMPWS